MFIWNMSLPHYYSKESSCPSHSWFQGNIPWKPSHHLRQPFHASWPPSSQPHFLMNTEGWAGMGAMETTGHRGTRTCRLPPGPLHSGGLSVKAKNFPLKLCKVSGVSLRLKLSPPPPTPNPFRTPHLHPPYPPMCSPPFPLFLPSPSDPFLKSAVHCPQKLSPYPPLSPSQAMQSKNWTWKKEWHRKSLVSLLQTK